MPARGVPPDDVPEVVRDLAASCMRFVGKAVGVEPDYTQDTLPLVDHYLRAVPEEAAEEVLLLVVPACGAYFGEVLRRHLGGGSWVCDDDDYATWRLRLPAPGLEINPIGVALEVARQEPSEGWGAELRVPPESRPQVLAAIDALGEVEEDRYYTFTTRLEVIEAAMGAMVPSPAPGTPVAEA